MTSLIVVAVLALFVLITVFKGVRIVPQGEEWIVERLGRYHSTLKPGLNIVIPYMDVVAYRLPTKDIILDVQEQEIITRDNAVIVGAMENLAGSSNAKVVVLPADLQETVRGLMGRSKA